jgi:hypothetical protein
MSTKPQLALVGEDDSITGAGVVLALDARA